MFKELVGAGFNAGRAGAQSGGTPARDGGTRGAFGRRRKPNAWNAPPSQMGAWPPKRARIAPAPGDGRKWLICRGTDGPEDGGHGDAVAARDAAKWGRQDFGPRLSRHQAPGQV